MARIDVPMPQMGESIAEGTLSRWLKKVGDSIKRDEPIFEISTDKVDAEIPAPSAGVLVEILVNEGQTVPVQTVVARLETDAAEAAKVGAGTSELGGTAKAPPAPVPAGDGTSAPARETQKAQASSSEPRAPTSKSVSPSPEPRAEGSSFEERLRTKSSPLVRKIAAEHGIELSGLSGSGLAGRVTKKDILAVIESGVPARPAASMYAPGGVEPHGPPIEPWTGDRVEPMTKIRRLTAEHMVLARRTAAHVTTFHEIDLTRVAKIRQQRRSEFEAQTGEKLTYLPFIIQAVLQGLAKYPIINAAAAGERIIYRKPYNIGIAVALDWGLIVPVIKNADNLSLAGLTRALNDLANRARAKKLRPEEVDGATFTITNYGVFGSLAGTPIIPVGTSAILGVGAIEKRPKVLPGVDGEDTIAIRTCAYFALSFDHRIVDGADADKFMAFLKTTLETATEPTA
ncbi:MAG TPA: dihydrolipoamide acetyltransferase family protein [Gemmatimonadaceae bacterium]|nr:dihydrolipoamide acetyltransferase family protein [Gemmatimonadaceae bacterium]